MPKKYALKLGLGGRPTRVCVRARGSGKSELEFAIDGDHPLTLRAKAPSQMDPGALAAMASLVSSAYMSGTAVGVAFVEKGGELRVTAVHVPPHARQKLPPDLEEELEVYLDTTRDPGGPVPPPPSEARAKKKRKKR